jgi:oxalate decarboxylase
VLYWRGPAVPERRGGVLARSAPISLAAAGIASLAALTGTQPAAAGDPSFMNNVPDPALAGKDLPTFKFALEKSDGKVVGNSYGKESTVTQLPISKGIAGVSMRLEPGALRTLHWHPNADEWQYAKISEAGRRES